MTQRSLRIGVFTPSVLLDIATQQGLFASANLDIEEELVASSPEQMRALTSGEYDLIFTGPDNVLAYRYLPENPLGALQKIRILASVDRGLGLALYARPGIDLTMTGERPVLGVDVPTSGFAFVAYALLEQAGLTPDDYDVVSLGSTPQRAEALLRGECDATILNAGNDIRAVGRGAVLLATVNAVGPYVGTVIATTGDVTDAVPSAQQRGVEVILGVGRDIVQGQRDAEVVASAQRILGLDAQGAEVYLQMMKSAHHGLVATGLLPRSAVETLVHLRQKFLPMPALADVLARLDEVISPDLCPLA